MQIVLPKYATRFDALSLSVCFLDLKGIGDTPRQASGFFWRKGNAIHLITNWHNLTGRNILDGKTMSNGWCPEKVIVKYFTSLTNASADQQRIPNEKTTVAADFEIPLFDNFSQPCWIQHKNTFKLSIDIAAFRIDPTQTNLSKIKCVNDFSFKSLFHMVGSDVFIVGHSIPKEQNAYPVPFPVWKRGSIASELFVPWNKRPAFLVDARTSKGMSGSPVFGRAYGPSALGDGTIDPDNILSSEFMGIYSGRILDDSGDSALGMVWYRNLIDQIIDDPAPGDRVWSPAELDGELTTATH